MSRSGLFEEYGRAYLSSFALPHEQLCSLASEVLNLFEELVHLVPRCKEADSDLTVVADTRDQTFLSPLRRGFLRLILREGDSTECLLVACRALF